ncbi:alpha/beta fold hydrolase [Planococcus sp. YIM B11945]|uniref:alpha/beta fold hydrolase n=1 Tax=Planococcus sp. YIM B11945 TaxID=3435410 RepID=UPI003D7E66A3
MKQRLLKKSGSTVSYYEWGNSANPSILCLHGLAGNGWYSFTELANQLKDHFHLVALDCPGHGGSSPLGNEKDYLFSNLAKWLDVAVREILPHSFVMMGHSWGADVALHYAKHFIKWTDSFCLTVRLRFQGTSRK